MIGRVHRAYTPRTYAYGCRWVPLRRFRCATAHHAEGPSEIESALRCRGSSSRARD